MKRLKKIGALLLAICLMVTIVPSEVFAASGSVSVSSASGTVGSTVSISCTAKMSGADIGGADVTLTYDPSALSVVSCSSGASGGSGSVLYSGYATGAGSSSLKFTVKFKILKEGSHGISVSSADVFDFESLASVGVSKSGGKVTGKAETTSNSGSSNSGSSNSGSSNSGSSSNNNTTPSEPKKDTNSKLSSLGVYPGSLSPAFDKGTTSYTVEVTDEVTEVTITAEAASSKAKVVVSGGKELQLGDNAAKVVVTAEDGSTTVYNINIRQKKLERIDINGTEYILNETIPEESIPAGFTASTITYNEGTFVSLVNEAGNMTLLSLQNGDVTKFYIYNAADQTFIDFIPVKITEGKYIYIKALDLANETFGANEVIKLAVGEQQVDAWKLDSVYSMVCAWDMQGQEVIYRHDNADGVYQKYVEIIEEPEEPEYVPTPFESFLADNYLYIIIGLAALVLILLITVIVLAVTRKKKSGKRRGRRKGRKDGLEDVDVERIE